MGRNYCRSSYYRCSDCNSKFTEPASEEFCYEEEYGLLSTFPTRTYGSYAVCPVCGSEEFDEEYLPEAVPAGAKLLVRRFHTKQRITPL